MPVEVSSRQTDGQRGSWVLPPPLPHTLHSLGLSPSNVRVAHITRGIKSLFPPSVSFSGTKSVMVALKVTCMIFKLNNSKSVRFNSFFHFNSFSPKFPSPQNLTLIKTVLTMDSMTMCNVNEVDCSDKPAVIYFVVSLYLHCVFATGSCFLEKLFGNASIHFLLLLYSRDTVTDKLVKEMERVAT